MKTKNFYRIVSAGLAVICGITMAGCTTAKGKADYLTALSENNCPYEEFIVVDVFDLFANYQGIQSGWFGELVKKKFNMELNIIAPNVTGGGDTLYDVRVAAGNLGDLIICKGVKGELQDLVNAGLIYNMENDLQGKEIMKYQDAIENLNSNVQQEGIYAIPSQVSSNAPDVPSEGVEPVYGPYIRWDLYKQLGYPELETLEDLLPVLKQMQENYPLAGNGAKTYGFSFFKEWDDNMMNAIKQPCCMYGYDEYGVVLAKADGTDFQSIIEDDSLYVRMLNFYFEANQLGLVDPESANQNYDQCFEKYKEGQVLFSPWPWLGQAAYNTTANVEAGKGFMIAPVKDMQIYSYGCYPYGNQDSVIAVGSKAKDPQRLVDFINWLYSDEGIMANGTNLSGAAAGPEGLTWEMREDGPYLTDFGREALLNGGQIQVPEEYGGGIWAEGVSTLNYKAVVQCEKNEAGYYYYYNMWDSVKELDTSPLKMDWKEKMGADTTMEYLQSNHMLLVALGTMYVAPVENSEQSTIRNQCKRAIQSYSWEMIFASDRESFESLLDEMQATVISYGYDTILEYDMTHAKAKIKTN
ncbi:MAG: ABC transporter substrate-binding protein [Lachnospiraceae bacterium]|nr:ABC transporter substrate-binding protein [Lachnospiraceae bacterium]